MTNTKTHAQIRLLERFGIDATGSDMADLLETTKSIGVPVRRQLDKFDGRVFLVKWRGKMMRIVLREEDNFIISVMTPTIDKSHKRNFPKKRGKPVRSNEKYSRKSKHTGEFNA